MIPNYTSVFLFLGFVLGCITIYLQLQYAKANYPKSSTWLVVRFGLAFFCGASLGIAIFDFSGLTRIIAVVLSGIAFIVLLGIVLEYRMRQSFPKR
jgi:predicted MFS family arabinose efflux permease